MNTKQLLSIVLLLALAALAWNFGWLKTLSGDEKQTAVNTDEAADFYLINSISRQFSETGELTASLSSLRLDYFDEKKVSLLQQPRFVFQPEQGAPWKGRSETGEMLHQPQRLTLQGNVHLNRDSSPQNVAMQLLTTSLTIDQLQQTLTTEAPLVLRQQHSRLAGTGLHADLQQQTLKILNNVEGEMYFAEP